MSAGYWLELKIYVLTVAYFRDDDMVEVELDVIDYPIPTRGNASQFRIALELLAICWGRVLLEGSYLVQDLPLQVLRKIANELFGLRFEFYGIHRSQSSYVQLSCQVFKTYTARLLYRLK